MLWDLSQPRQLRSHHARSARHQATADIDALAARGLAYEHLDQLALEHLYGVR